MIEFDIGPDAKTHQRAIILHALRNGPLSTLDARQILGVFGVAVRVFELRRSGYEIKTKMELKFDAEGRPHKCAVYSLSHDVGKL